MKLVCPVLLSLCVTAVLWGQTNPGVAPTAPSNQATPLATQTQSMATDLRAWRMEHMLRLIKELKAMHGKLDEMKANTAKIEDPALKQQLQLENELWAMMLTHVQEVTAINSQVSQPQARRASSSRAYQQSAIRAENSPGSAPATPAPASESVAWP